jgi:arylsulfatase A-like enzyme
MQPPYNGPCFGRPVNLPPDLVSLYDLQNDPQELNNLAENPAHQDLLSEMKEKLLIRLVENMQGRPDSPGSVL